MLVQNQHTGDSYRTEVTRVFAVLVLRILSVLIIFNVTV